MTDTNRQPPPTHEWETEGGAAAEIQPQGVGTGQESTLSHTQGAGVSLDEETLKDPEVDQGIANDPARDPSHQEEEWRFTAPMETAEQGEQVSPRR